MSQSVSSLFCRKRQASRTSVANIGDSHSSEHAPRSGYPTANCFCCNAAMQRYPLLIWASRACAILGTRRPASIARPLASALGRVLKAPNQQTCRSCNRRNSNWSSTTRPPVCSASTFRDQKTIAPPSRCHVVFHTLHAAMKRADHAVAPGIEDQVWWIGYLPDDLRPAHPLRRIARSSSSAPHTFR